ncbi:unnamed protein product [Paramecium primaurelia]|uniref:Uncharacterized protein n=1 Tax=Paramecium primaurelia TaxID=5886 RepID=A0A8S1QKW5_PARPR|nr:unnamed protein product [Paramecium primaurelia]
MQQGMNFKDSFSQVKKQDYDQLRFFQQPLKIERYCSHSLKILNNIENLDSFLIMLREKKYQKKSSFSMNKQALKIIKGSKNFINGSIFR